MLAAVMAAASLETVLVAAERNDTVAVLWGIVVVIGIVGVLAGLGILVSGGSAEGTLRIEIGPIKAGNIGLGLFILILGVAAGAVSFDKFVTEVGKDPSTRCDETGVAGEVDPAQGDRQPARGTACVNADAVATFFDGQLRVTLRDFNARRIRSAVLETTGDDTPIHTACPFVWSPGLAAGDTISLRYRRAPEDAATEESMEWVVKVEQVLANSARVVVERSAFTYGGRALRELRREAPRGGDDVMCGSSSAALVAQRAP
jgi:hypothetical protein